MKNVTIARGYTGLQAFIPVIKSRKEQPANVQELKQSAPLKVKTASTEQGRIRLLAKRETRIARRLARQA